ncbi:MAG: S8 family serine peptidase, partial [Rhodothermia bacterium]
MNCARLLTLVLVATVTLPPRQVRAQAGLDANAVKFWISFVDKNNGTGKGPLAIEPDFVSERARARRIRRGGRVRSKLDVPVSPHYLNRLRSLGIELVTVSRWLNAVSAYLTPEQSAIVSRLGFVRSVTTVARRIDPEPPTPPGGPAPDRFYGQKSGKGSLQNSELASTLLDYGASLAQLQSINAVDPIENGFIGEGLLLGFLDTTTDTLHPALQHLVDSAQIVAMRDFASEAGLGPQTNKHGLYTTSTAMGFDEGNLIGACYGAEYIFATTEYAPSERNQEEDFFVAGMEWMEQMGADIVNVSLAYSTFDAGQN